MPSLQQKQDQWKASLDLIKLRTTKGIFDTHLAGTYVLPSDNGLYRIAVRDARTQMWLQNRLDSTISTVLTAVAGEPGQIEYVIAADTAPPPSPPRPEPTPAPQLEPEPEPEPIIAYPSNSDGEIIDRVDWRALRDRAYTPVGDYGTIFWQAWLDQQNIRAYKVWLAIQTYDNRNTFGKDFDDFWTPPRSFRIRELAGIVGAGRSTPTLTGRMTNCAACERAIDDGTPLDQCCGAHHPTIWKDMDYDERMCQYWSLGAFECLQDAGLLASDVTPGTTNSHQMQLQVWRLLPVLTPAQLADLPDILQIRHDQWLASYGERIGLSQTDWQAIQAGNLVYLMPGYDYRSLGAYTWNKIIRESLHANACKVPNSGDDSGLDRQSLHANACKVADDDAVK